MIVTEDRWQSPEAELKAVLDRRVPHWREVDRFKVYGTSLRACSGHFSGVTVARRIAFRDSWMDMGAR
ncbi:MAG: hypothetical protein JWO31_1247 [Phycisphaerales bacterium]|nr:hypothetical protein [Phycisphaerales bacterium]